MRKPPIRQKWTPWVRASHNRAKDGTEFAIPPHIAIFINNAYSVSVQVMPPQPPFGRVVWLSIKRLDRRTIHDWRELQRIKNDLIGPEYEAVEIYPAESRLVDTSNQYHLWVFIDKYQIPFGYEDRRVADETVSVFGARQRPFEPGERPADCVTGPDLVGMSCERLRVPGYERTTDAAGLNKYEPVKD